MLRSILGAEIIEMSHNRNNAWCCGAGGGVKAAYPDFALWSASERLKEAEAVSAEAIATACPFCERNISDAIKQANSKLKLYDIVELLAEAI